MYQSNNQYQPSFGNNFGQYQYPMIEPPMPQNQNSQKSGSKFWIGFIMGIITIAIGYLGFTLIQKLRGSKPETPAPPHPEPKTKEEVKEVAEFIIEEHKKNVQKSPLQNFMQFEPIEKQTFDDFLKFLQAQGFELQEDLDEVTGNEVWKDDGFNEIHIGNIGFTIKKNNGNQINFPKKEALNLRFNQDLLEILKSHETEN